MVNTS